MRPNIDDHDYDTKMKKVHEFIGDGDKVKVTLRFRGRELSHGQLGMAVLAAGRRGYQRGGEGRSLSADGRAPDADGAVAEIGDPARATGQSRNPIRHAGLVPASAVPRTFRPLIWRDGGPRNKSGVTVKGLEIPISRTPEAPTIRSHCLRDRGCGRTYRFRANPIRRASRPRCRRYATFRRQQRIDTADSQVQHPLLVGGEIVGVVLERREDDRPALRLPRPLVDVASAPSAAQPAPTPRWSRYQAFSASGSRARKNRPPIPRTGMIVSPYAAKAITRPAAASSNLLSNVFSRGPVAILSLVRSVR